MKAVVACSVSELELDAVRSWGFEALASSEQCSSGSERLASVVAEHVRVGGCSAVRTLVINVQGDQPCLDPGIVEEMIREAGRLSGGGEHSWMPVITPVYPLGGKKLPDPSMVKVLRAANGRAITFSRSAITHVQVVPAEQWHEHTTYWGHVGIYGYRGMCWTPGRLCRTQRWRGWRSWAWWRRGSRSRSSAWRQTASRWAVQLSLNRLGQCCRVLADRGVGFQPLPWRQPAWWKE